MNTQDELFADICADCGSIPLAADTDAAKACHVDPVNKCAILGVSQVIAQIHGGAVLIHGPKGCAFPAFEASLYDPLIFNYSEMCERSVVFGAEVQLKEKIYDTYYDNLPSLLGLVTTCSSEIIGEDVKGVVSISDLPIPIVPLEGVGFRRDNRQAVDHAMTEIVCERIQGRKRASVTSDGSINLIGHVGTSVRWKDEVLHLEELLKQFGRPVRRLFCSNQLADFDHLMQAAVTVLVSPDIGNDPAQLLNGRYGIPIIKSALPVGLEQTVGWLNAVGNVLGVDRTTVLDRDADVIRTRFRDAMGRVNSFRPLEILQRIETIVVAEPVVAVAYTHFLSNELDCCPQHVVLKSQSYDRVDLTNLRARYPKTTFIEIADNMQLKALFEQLKPKLLLGNDVEYLLARPVSDPIYINISYPGARLLKTSSRPYLGFEGTLNFAEDLVNSVIERFSYP